MTNKHDWVNVWLESMEHLLPKPKNRLPDFYYSDEIRAMGISCGDNCMLHKTTIIVNPEKLSMGSNVRIDGFSTFSCGEGFIEIGNNVHIAGYVTLMGGAGIVIYDFASIASGAKIYSVSDDVMGRGLVGPCVPLDKRYLHRGGVYIGEHAVVCVNATLMPGCWLGMGSTLLPYSLLTTPTGSLEVWGGQPAEFKKPRKSDFLKQ